MDAQKQYDLDVALHSAVQNGELPKAEEALKAGANTEALNIDGYTALRMAAYGGNADMCALLLDHGADIEAKRHGGGFTALMWAAGEGYSEVCKMLIARGANIETTDSHGNTPLLWAGKRNCESVGILLLHAGAKMQDNANVQKWHDNMQDLAQVVFYAIPSRRADVCMSGQSVSEMTLNACATDQFGSLIAEPLIRSHDPKDHVLFQKIWDALPDCWQQKNQGLYIDYAKRKKEVTPAIQSQTEGRVQR